MTEDDGNEIEESLCRKLYEATRQHRGVQLTYDEVFMLVRMDDAVTTRIDNEAERRAAELGQMPRGPYDDNPEPRTWQAYVNRFRGAPQ